jgi:VIT1/CCC1 family predicted Fe2+/Mn2+ transporter
MTAQGKISLTQSDTSSLTLPAADGAGEGHYVNRIGWLRAAVLGANDGLLSTGSLMSGVAAAAVAPGQLVLTGVAGIIAGAMSMAAGEFVSVSSQADTEAADRRREARELKRHPLQEAAELKAIYKQRGLDDALAGQVASALMRNDALEAHMRDELGITEASTANPLQAAAASAGSFVTGGLAPLLVALLLPGPHVLTAIMLVTIAMLALLGAVGAKAGGAPILPGVTRVVIFGTAAMVITALAGHLFHAAS